MPGNPLPVDIINLEDRGWPYDSGTWGDIPVTAAPKAVLDANAEPSTEIGGGLSRGYIKVLEPIEGPNVSVKYPNTLSPDGTNRGWKLTYGAVSSAYNDNGGMEINYKILVPSDHNFEMLRIRQPDNYEHKRIVALYINDYSEVSDWQAGDSISSGNFYGEIYSIEDDKTSPGNRPSVAIHRYGGGHPSNAIDTGSVVTNTRTGTSVTSAGQSLTQNGMKFMSMWVDDGTAHDGYSNSGYLVGVVGSSPQYDDVGNGVATASVQKGYDLEQNTLQNPSSDYVNDGFSIYDTADNGHWINIVVERKRSSALDVADGVYRIWKKVERVGSSHQDWTLLFEKTNVNRWSPYSDNNFTHGYLFGNSNAGHYEDTDYYLNRWEYWTQKPTFLPEAA